MKRLIVCLVVIVCCVSAFSDTFYVSTNGSSIVPYDSWVTAATNIQDAVDAASASDTVLVTNGIYNAGGAVTPGYALTNRICITLPITLRSMNGPDYTFIVGAADSVSSNAAASVRCVYMVENVVLDGFTLTNGHARISGDWAYDESGGGVFLDQGGTVTNCCFSGNLAEYGGGAECYIGGTLNNCRFLGNTAEYGGGAECDDAGTLNHCVLSGNVALSDGGGVACDAGGTLNGCILSGNEADGSGGGMDCYGGGTLNNCTLIDNLAYYGGGAECNGGGTLNSCIVSSNTAEYGGGVECDDGGTLNNCVLSGNVVLSDGGGVECDAGGTLNGCTLSGNQADGSGGGIDCYGGGTLNNCILWDNTGGDGNDIYDDDAVAIRYTCASDGLSHGVAGCIIDDPKFVDAASGNYRLQAASPCINAGLNAYVVGTVDMDDNARILYGTVDMGAYECVEAPVVAITDPLDGATVAPEIEAMAVQGVNNTNVVGTMVWTNSANGANGSFEVSGTTFQVSSISLAYGENTLAVTGTNRVGVAASDSITVTRTVHPAFVGITNPVGPVAFDTEVDTVTIQGTNAYVVGTMVWTNGANGANGSFAVSGTTFQVSSIPLAYGENRLTVTGTNRVGMAASDSITVTRTVHPASVGITNPAGPVSFGMEVDLITIQGTNAHVVGTMVWTNGATGAMSSFAAVSPWEIVVLLASGDNEIIVSGTNVLGEATADSVVVTRNPLHTGDSPIHYVSTTGAAVWPYTNWMYAATNIQAAVDAAMDSDIVSVAAGTYYPSVEITVSRDITIEGVNGPSATVVDAQNDCRCFNLGSNTCVVSGFTIQNGSASGYNYGGGVCCTDLSPVITNCTLMGNVSFVGGGSLYGTLNDCMILSNTAFIGGGSCASILNDCMLSGNEADSGGGSGAGMLNRCSISGNTASKDGGGCYGDSLNNCTVSGNSAGNSGGGCNVSLLKNCTIKDNEAGVDAGGSIGGSLTNCIIWDNTVNGSINNCTSSTLFHCCTTLDSGGIGTISAAPLFVDASTEDYHLQPGSPCIDAGNNSDAPSGFDLDGNTRIINGTVDMGAYEYSGFITDSDGDDFSDYDEYIADTGPADNNDWFHISGFSNNTVFFDSSSNRLYTLLWTTNLIEGVWTNLSSQTDVMGSGGEDSFIDSSTTNPAGYYRVQVELP